jgi:pullulanase
VSGVDSLKQLGVNYVQFLPVFGCNTLDEISGGSPALATSPNGSRYNWCYDPRNYNAPNGAYATDPHGTARISELKQAVQALHKRGMGVVLDVVYNHTNSQSVFDPIVPNYYYRQDYSGNLFNFAGPSVAATRPMVCKFITDSASYWMREYHVDGFRFDAMSILGKNCMSTVSQELHKINPNTVLYGEPWSTLPANWQRNLEGGAADEELTQGVQQGMGLAGYNDGVRNATVNDVFNSNKEFATGDPTKGLGVMIAAVGETNYNSEIKGWTAKPSEAINYVSNHDNKTLWDRIAAAQPNAPEATRIRMDELSQAIVFTSQGIPLMQGGEELLRTKGGDDNSYQSGDIVNMLDWNRKATYGSVFSYYNGLLHLRAAHPAFRMNSASLIQNHLQFLENVPQFVVAYKLTGHANGDKWKTIMVIFNPNSTSEKIPLSKGTWHVVASGGKVATKAFATAKGKVTAAPYSATILYQ